MKYVGQPEICFLVDCKIKALTGKLVYTFIFCKPFFVLPKTYQSNLHPPPPTLLLSVTQPPPSLTSSVSSGQPSSLVATSHCHRDPQS